LSTSPVINASDSTTEPSPEDASLDAPKGSHGHKLRERKDIASGEVMDPARMVRVGYSPDGEVVADIYGKLPGRGAWVASERASVEKALKTKAFIRAAKGTKGNLRIADNFADVIEQGLKERVLGLLAMTNRAGAMESGFDKVRGCAGGGNMAYRFEARTGAPDGRSKIRVIAKAVAKELEQRPPPVIGCFDEAQLGKIIGRDHAVHIAVHKGRLARALHAELSRLAGFCALVPDEWTDKNHEEQFMRYTRRADTSREIT
jgi:predicted RNA-binding protein YlxR (DUF448 family)